jgi:hypothetical protein
VSILVEAAPLVGLNPRVVLVGLRRPAVPQGTRPRFAGTMEGHTRLQPGIVVVVAGDRRQRCALGARELDRRPKLG